MCLVKKEEEKYLLFLFEKKNNKEKLVLSGAVCKIKQCSKDQNIQSILVISNSKGPSEIFRDIRTSTYDTCRIVEKINRTTTFHK